MSDVFFCAGPEGARGAVARKRVAATTRARLLVIDDEPDMLRMLSFMLSLEGFEIATVASGGEAIRLMEAERFDLALTDLRMPGMDGFQTIKALKALDPLLAIIVATGYATPETTGLCKAIGAFDLIKKPFNVLELTSLLRRALEAREV